MKSQAKKIVVSEFRLITKNFNSRFEYCVESENLPNKLWFEVQSSYQSFLNHTGNAALISLLMPAMKLGHDIDIEVPISPNLVNQCVDSLIPVLASMTGYQQIKINAKSPKLDTSKKERYTATGFSGGVDSYAVIEKYFWRKNLKEELKLTHLVFSNVGANGTIEEVGLYKQRRRQAVDAARELGLPLINVNSNMDEFYRFASDLYFARNHSLRNIAVGLLLSEKISNYKYASGHHFSETTLSGPPDIAFADPIILSLLNTEKIIFEGSGGEYTRAEKIERIVDDPIVQNHLYVCVNHEAIGNCSECQKCLRTLLIIDLLGYLGKYENSFDLEKYKRLRRLAIRRAHTSTDIFSRQFQKLFAQQGKKLNITDVFIVNVTKFKNSTKALLKQILMYLSNPTNFPRK